MAITFSWPPFLYHKHISQAYITNIYHKHCALKRITKSIMPGLCSPDDICIFSFRVFHMSHEPVFSFWD